LKNQSLVLANYGLHLIFALFIAALQCSLWMQIFGSFPAPHFWLPTLVYWSIYRDLGEGLIMTYLLTIFLASLTALPLGLFFFINLSLFLTSYFSRKRFYWSGTSFFMMNSALMTFLFVVFHFIFSWSLEKNPIQELLFFQWIMKPLLTALSAFFFHRFLIWMDTITEKDWPTETGSLAE